MEPLPIDPHLPSLVRGLQEKGTLILRASPGSGKTTRFPPALVAEASGQVWVLEPRRLAAKLAAHRVAAEQGWNVGQEVGYQFRLENRTSANTALHFLTEGIFLRRLASNPRLEGVSAVLLDEFHERHLQTDIALGCLRHLQESRPDLQVGILSATLDVTPLRSYFSDPLVFDVELPLHPVVTHYQELGRLRLEEGVRRAVREAIQKKIPGHVLVFVPGRRQIDDCIRALNSIDADVFPLHGDLPREAQEAALRPCDKRKVIVSTNIAESSLTIDGVQIVVDSGLHRRLEVDPWTGVSTLITRPISKASADQRQGRAGRQGPGTCYRLYSEGDFRGRVSEDVPELRRSDLSQTLLDLKALGIWEAFPWLDPPDASNVEGALLLLQRLGALDGDALTDLGKQMAKMGLAPRLSRLLLGAQSEGCLREAAALAAKLQEGSWQHNDALAQLDRLSNRESRSRDRLLQLLTPKKNEGQGDVSKALLQAFPDTVARRTGPVSQGHVELRFCTGGRGRTPHLPFLDTHEWFVVLEVQSLKDSRRSGARTEIRALAPIEEDWLMDNPGGLLAEPVTLEWDQKKAVQWTRIQFGELPLIESKDPPAPSPSLRRLLFRHGFGLDPNRLGELDLHEWLEGFKKLQLAEVVESALARVHWVGRAGLVAVEDLSRVSLLPCWETLIENCTSVDDLRALPWSEAISRYWLNDQGHRLSQWAPATVPLEKLKVKVHYQFDKEPWIESRLQDFFGQSQGPTILEGKIPLTLHLLAPNYRAVQVTRDLASFWRETYPEVRNQLSRRYPRHDWPEDPLSARPPQRGQGKRRH